MSQPSCVFDTCCGCIKLRTGCLIIGYLQLVNEIIFIVMGLMLLLQGMAMASHTEQKEAQEAGVIIMAVAGVLLLLLLFFLAFTIVLLVGVHKNKRGHVKVYLIWTTVLLVLYTIGVLISLGWGFNAVDFALKLISLALSIYILMVVRSYYYKMDDGKPPAYNYA